MRRCAASSGSDTSARAWPIDSAPDATSLRTSTRQAQQPDVVGDRRAILADGRRNRLLRHRELLGQPSVGLRFFDGVEVLALDILDERDLEQLIVRHVAHRHRHLQQSRTLRGAPAALAGDDLVAGRRRGGRRSAGSRRDCGSTARAPRAGARRSARAAGASSARAGRYRARSAADRAPARRRRNERAQSAAKSGRRSTMGPSRDARRARDDGRCHRGSVALAGLSSFGSRRLSMNSCASVTYASAPRERAS